MKLTKFFTALFAIFLSFSVLAVDIADLTKRAEQDNIKAQKDLVYYYNEQQNNINEFKWTKKLAEQGDVQAQYFLGLMYNEGDNGIRQDKHRAKEFFGQACDNGHQLSCERYQILNEQGD